MKLKLTERQVKPKRVVLKIRGLNNPQWAHGMAGTGEYQSWNHAKMRCYNSTHPQYKNYGARGISMCDRWRNSFLRFLQDMGPKPPGLTLERIDNYGDYTPANCKWASVSEQNRNKRTCRLVTFGAETHTLTEWSKITGIRFQTLEFRMFRGLPPEKILSPVNLGNGRAVKCN